MTVYFSFRYLRTIRWVHLVLAVLLSFSTVFCRYHFVVDVIAGVLTAAVMLPLGNWLYRRPKRIAVRLLRVVEQLIQILFFKEERRERTLRIGIDKQHPLAKVC